MPEKRSFRYDDVLSCSQPLLVSSRGIKAVYEVFDFLTNDSGVTTMAIAFLCKPIQKYLAGKYPFLAKQEVLDGVNLGVAEWRKSGGDSDAFGGFMEKFVRPHLPSEFVEIERMEPTDCSDIEENYPAWLEKALAGKQVIAVGVGGEA